MAAPISALLRLAGAALSPAGRRARLSILIYHRVLPEGNSMLPRIPDAEAFDWQMHIVASLFNVLPLSEAVERFERGTLPTRAACITFDDGYADNASVALPILRRYGLPATFFIATGFLDGRCMWNDRIIEAVSQTPKPGLDLSALELGSHCVSTPASRRQTISTLLPKIKYRPVAERDACAGAIEQVAGTEAPVDYMMRPAQVRGLHDAGMEIGAHTVTHPILSKLASNEAREEIAGSRERLEDIIESPVRLFAYPNGKPGQDYTSEHTKMMEPLGFDAAVSTISGSAGRGHDRYQLPRFTPWDRTRNRFAVRLVGNYLRSGQVLG